MGDADEAGGNASRPMRGKMYTLSAVFLFNIYWRLLFMNREKIKTRICIIGAGPSGATASIFLGKMGIPHLIVDAADFPRDKVCGDGLDLNTIRVLNHIDPSIVQHELANKELFTASAGVRFILPNGKQVEVKRDFTGNKNERAQYPIFFVSRRSNFDNLLVSKINRQFADLRLRTRITDISRAGKIWNLTGKNGDGVVEIETEFLIGADGDHSVLLGYLGERKIDRDNYAGALRQYWGGISGIHTENLIEVYFPASLPFSYFWIFPLPEGEANVGFGMASNHISKLNINLRKVFEELIKTDPFLRERFKNGRPLESVKGWGVPMAGNNRNAYGDGWLLLGDAASIVSPTSGEGIGFGMMSAYIAAKFIERGIQANDLSEAMFVNYNREIHKRLKRDEKLYRLINYLPGGAFSFLIKTILSNRYLQKRLIHKEMHKWVETAYTKEITVSF